MRTRNDRLGRIGRSPASERGVVKRETRARSGGKFPVIIMGARISELTPSIFAVHRTERHTPGVQVADGPNLDL